MQLGCHFDSSPFSVSLILQPAETGEAFEFAPGTRDATGAEDARLLRNQGQAESLKAQHPPPEGKATTPRSSRAPESSDVEALEALTRELNLATPQLEAGDLYIFEGWALLGLLV